MLKLITVTAFFAVASPVSSAWAQTDAPPPLPAPAQDTTAVEAADDDDGDDFDMGWLGLLGLIGLAGLAGRNRRHVNDPVNRRNY